MADEDLASAEEAEALELAPETDGVEPADDPIANLATEMGWTPKDQWQGEPDKWRPADEFIRAGRDIQRSTAQELRSLRQQMERIGGVTEQIVQDRVAERDTYWQRQFNQAVEDGDTERAAKLVEQRPASQPRQAGPAPEVSDWVSRNDWFTKDPLAQARAQEISDRLKHLPVQDQLTQVERAIRKEFPEHFPAPAKQPPATQTGQARTAAPSNRARGFADMPADSQKMALDYERRMGVKRDDFAKSYWADKGRVSR